MLFSILFATFVWVSPAGVLCVPLAIDRSSASLTVRINENVSLLSRGSEKSPSPPPVQHSSVQHASVQYAADTEKPVQQREEYSVILRKPEGYDHLSPERKKEIFKTKIEGIEREVNVKGLEEMEYAPVALCFCFRGVYTPEEISRIQKHPDVEKAAIIGVVRLMNSSPTAQHTIDTTVAKGKNPPSQKQTHPKGHLNDNIPADPHKRSETGDIP